MATGDFVVFEEALEYMHDGGWEALDVIKCADHVIDLGPEGGVKGGFIVAEGTPEEIAAVPESYTGFYLKEVL